MLPAAWRPKVVIAQSWVSQYRSEFYAALRRELDARGVDLVIVHGRPTGSETEHSDKIDVPGAVVVENTMITVAGKPLIFTPVLGATSDADLVIVEQATKNLATYLLLMRHVIGGPKLAMWGHGQNFQTSEASAAGEAIKRWMSRRVHWWFAYNDLSAEVVADLGFPRDRITSVRNAIDTRRLIDARVNRSGDEIERIRQDLVLRGDHVGIFCGTLSSMKRTAFMLEAARETRARIPDFELIVVGTGSDAGLVHQATQKDPWIHPVGAKFGSDRVPYFAVADLLFMPGAVGLAILDSFAFEVPLITSDTAEHGPEIDYLIDGVNGVMVHDAGDPQRYAKAVAALLRNPGLLESLRRGCEKSAGEYSLEEMVGRFASGVQRALAC
jgi:glycosyltransferase involved in cell wall biosynthesis